MIGVLYDITDDYRLSFAYEFASLGSAPINATRGPLAGTLQGTEMWLSIAWLMAELLGASASLGYRPRGVYRIEVAGAGIVAGSTPEKEFAETELKFKAILEALVA